MASQRQEKGNLIQVMNLQRKGDRPMIQLDFYEKKVKRKMNLEKQEIELKRKEMDTFQSLLLNQQQQQMNIIFANFE